MLHGTVAILCTMVKLTVQGIAEEEINDAFEFLSVTLAEPLELLGKEAW